jgi:glycosyltransferase involved in cell wall biosynthesis
MKVILISAPNSSHTIKWANSLFDAGIEVGLFGLSLQNQEEYYDGIKFEIVDYGNISTKDGRQEFMKINYLKALPKLRRFIRSFNPDLIHAHYVSSYGLLGALSGRHPFILSVWGTDILEFPLKSRLRKWLITFNFKKADAIFATSRYLASAAQQYTDKSILISPFGVNLDRFNCDRINKKQKDKDDLIVIGTVKTLEPIYGIDILIKAYKILKEKNPTINMKLLIVGEGNERQNLAKLVKDLSLEKSVEFTGYIPPSKIANYFSQIDIFANLSRRESFGVSVLEAMACHIPVVATSVGGLKEIVSGECGFLVPPDNITDTVKALEKLAAGSELRSEFGKKGRLRVQKYYDWNRNISDVISVYNKYIK